MKPDNQGIFGCSKKSITKFMISFGVLVATGVAAAQPQSVPVNDLPNPYKTLRSWAEHPLGEWAAVISVEVARDGSVYAITRCKKNSCIDRSEPPIYKFDKNGKFITAFGENMMVFPHGATLDAEGNLWVTDLWVHKGKGGAVYKFSPEGKLLMTLGKPGIVSDAPGLFDEPSDVAVAHNGDIFVTEGHSEAFGFGTKGNDRVSKFDKNGKFLMSWGKTGSGPGEFRDPHTIAFDSQGRVFVGDRSNNRIQIFDQNGKHLETWTQWSRPSGIAITEDDMMYVVDSESWGKNNPGWKKGIRIGSAKTGEIKYFIPDWEATTLQNSGAEGVAVDSEGNVYGGVVRRMMLEKHLHEKNIKQ